MEKNIAESVIERGIRAAELKEGALCGEAIEWLRVRNRTADRCAAREQRQRIRDLRANRVDSSNVKALWAIKNVPAGGGIPGKRGGGEIARGAVKGR
jgi:hypothetical protein